LPDAFSGRIPGIVQGPGFMNLKESQRYIAYHERLTAAGYAILIFDYRGFGESEGERGLLLPMNQVEDIRNAITYLETRPEVDPKRIGLHGIGGTGGAHAVYVAGVDERVKCAVSNTAFADGSEWLRYMRRRHEWTALLNRVEEVRRHRVLTGEDELIEPVGGVEALMVESPHRKEVAPKAAIIHKLPSRIPFRCLEALLDYRPLDVVHKISPRAIMWIAVERDVTTPEESIIRMYECAGSPKRLVLQKDVEHYHAYDRYFEDVIAQILDWYGRYLIYEPFEVRSRVGSHES
jgi:hypothetical protein